jgi:hypothetical protein
MWHLYITEFYLGPKKNEVLSLTGKWMELENFILSEISQAQVAKSHVFFSFVKYRHNTNITLL